jgi:uncharacterized membrane protein
MVQLAILTALLLVLAFTPIGYLRLGPFSITFMPVPVVIGAILLGPGGGAFLGLVFGLTSFAQCFGIDPMGTALMTINIFYTFVMTVVTRTLVGYLTALVFRGMRSLFEKLPKSDKTKPVTYAIASAAGPLFNTVLFMSAMYIFFGKEQVVLDAFELTAAVPFFVFVFGIVFAQALVELLVTMIIGTAVCVALDHAKIFRK